MPNVNRSQVVAFVLGVIFALYVWPKLRSLV